MNASTTFGMVVAAVLPLVGGAAAKPAAAPASKETVRQAIAIFRRDPAGPQGTMAQPLILGFAKDRPDFEVVVGQKLLPWLEDGSLPKKDSSILITAYCAGNIASQMEGGSAHDTALVRACEQVIATYRQLQDKDRKLTLPGVEKLIILEKEHKLRPYVRDAEREIRSSQ